MRTLKIDSKTFKIAAFLADSIKAQAVEPAKAKADALEVGEIVIEGQALTLPKATIDQILAMLGAGGGPSTPEPAMDEGDMPPKPPMDPAMMADEAAEEEPVKDAKTDAAIAARVDRLVAAALAKHVPTTAARIADAATATAR